MTPTAFLVICLCSLIYWFPACIIVVAVCRFIKRRDAEMRELFQKGGDERLTKRGGREAAPLLFPAANVVKPI